MFSNINGLNNSFGNNLVNFDWNVMVNKSIFQLVKKVLLGSIEIIRIKFMDIFVYTFYQSVFFHTVFIRK